MIRRNGKREPFARGDRGVVTIEWVAIAAVVVIAAVAITVMIFNGAADLGSDMADKMGSMADDDGT